MLPQNTESNFNTFQNIFEKFAPGRSYSLCISLYNRFVVDDFRYLLDDELFLKVYNYLVEKVIPHKQEVYKAGMELMKKQAFEDFITNGADRDLYITNLFYHDLSKFSGLEAIGYAKYNFKTKEGKDDFEIAWHHHKMNNPHHPEYWFNPNRSGELEPIPMPVLYAVEMVADWIGAGRTYGSTLEQWLPDNLPKFKFGASISLVQNILREMLGITTYIHEGRVLSVNP